MTDTLDILFLCHHYPPEMGGGATRFQWLTRRLAQSGHRVRVVTGMPNYPVGVIFPGYRGKLALTEQRDGVEVRRVWVYPAAFGSRWKRLANYLSFVISSALACLSGRQRYDAMIAASPPLFVALAGWIIARSRRIPWVFDIGDLWPDVAVEAGELSENGLVTRWARGLAVFLYRRASYLAPVTETKRARLMAMGIPAEKIVVVENTVDIETGAPIDDKDWRADLNLAGRFVVVYAGLIGIAQGVEIALDAATALRDRPEIAFLIVGDGVRRTGMVEAARQMKLENITFLPAQPREAIPAILRCADVAWIPLANNLLVDAVPSKLMEAWACGKAVILSAAGEAAALVSEAGGGLVTLPGQPEALVEAVLRCQADPARLLAWGANGQALVKARFDPQTLANRMADLLRRSVEQAGSHGGPARPTP